MEEMTIDKNLSSNTNCKIVLKDDRIIYGQLLSVNENYVYIHSDNGNRIKKDNIKELYMYYDCEVTLKDGRVIYGNFVGDFGDHKLHLDDSFNRKGWAIKDEMIKKVNYKKIIKHTFDTDTLNESADSLHNNKTIDIDGEQKSIYNSRGEKIADTEESLRKFYKWFNNSKAVDSKNRPYVMYHGTYDKFDSFSYQYSGKNDSGFYGKGFYFTYDYGYAKKYGKKIMRVYLKINNPYKMTTDSKENMINYMLKNGHMDKKTASSLLNKLNKAGEIVGTGWLQMADKESYNKISRKISEMFSESLIKDGYDGIMTYREYMVFNPNQIKSVKNNGNWSNDTDKLNESVEDKLNDNFWKWFGNSKCVDEQGKPLVFYHGTKSNFTNFDMNKAGENYGGYSAYGKGMCFTTDESFARRWGNKAYGLNKTNVMAVYLSIQNPYRYSPFNSDSTCNHKKISVEEMIEQGYDGILDFTNSPQCFEAVAFYPNQIKSVNNNGEWSMTSNNINESVEDKILYIIRGVPGSGKSTLAHKLTDNVVEADQYFYDDKGNYNWSADKLNQAHNWCFYTVKKYMEEGRDKIAVANTFVKKRDYKRYVELAEQFGYKIDIRVCNGNFKNIHGVPDETVERMRAKFQLDESKQLNESFFNTDWGETIYYTTSENNFISIIKNKFKNIPVRVYYDFNKRLYVFGNAMNLIHSSLFFEMVMNTKKYKQEEKHWDKDNYHGDDYGWEEDYIFYTYLEPNAVLFQIIWDTDVEKYTSHDDYDTGYWTKYDDFYIICRDSEYRKCNKVPLLWNLHFWNQKYDPMENVITESAENDKTLRDYAVKLANICLDAIVKTKYKSYFTKTQFLIDVNKEFKKACPILKKSPYEYFLSLSGKEETYPYFSKTTDRKFGVITLPIVPKNPYDYAWDLLMKHKSMLNKILSTYQGTEQSEKIKDISAKYLKKALEKTLSNIQHRLKDALIHECTHLIDDIRRSQTYKPKEQETDTDKGREEYYNSPIEQNAYYQETISIFDDWAKDVGYKKFDIFFDDFIRQYRGNWNMLNEKNKRKLKKRAYAYWELYIKD